MFWEEVALEAGQVYHDLSSVAHESDINYTSVIVEFRASLHCSYSPTQALHKGDLSMLQILTALALAIAIALSTAAPSDPPSGGGGGQITSSDPPTGGGGGAPSDPPTGGGGGRP